MTLIKNGSSGIYKIPQIATFRCSHYCVTCKDQISRPSSHFLSNPPPISGGTRYEGIFLDLPLYSGNSGEFSQRCLNNFKGLFSEDLFSQSDEKSTDMATQSLGSCSRLCLSPAGSSRTSHITPLGLSFLICQGSSWSHEISKLPFP